MKKFLPIILIMCLSLPMMAGIHSYADQSVLANGKWVKIRVSETGVCRMSFDELSAAGLTPSQVRVFGYGGAQKEQDFSKRNIDDLPQVPVYIGDSYILFYVQGPISWTYKASAGRFTHTRNTYSDYGYYFLTDNVGSLLPPTEGSAVSGTPTDETTFVYHMVHDKDSLNLVDRSGVAGGGRTFYGEQFTANQTRSFSFSTPNAITTEKSRIYVDVAANAPVESYFYASLNGGTSKSVFIASIPDHYTFGVTGTIDLSNTSAASTQRIQLQLKNNNASALGWLNYIELTTPASLQMNGDYMGIRSLTNRGTSTPVRFHLTGANANTQVWDVTNLAAIKKMPLTLSGNEATWVGSQKDGVHEYVAVNTRGSSFVHASVVGSVNNQDLHSWSNIDFVIICPEGYQAYATELAQAHQAKQAITWKVVTDKQVYNEFSSGTPDACAYRWLMKMLYDRANNGQGNKPRWLLLFGHGSFDNRNICQTQYSTSTSGSKLLLTYQAVNSVNEVNAYASDDFFGWLDDNEGATDRYAKMDIGVGRLPIESEEEARTTVDKLIAYMQNDQPGKWKSQLMFLADDGENGMHTETAEQSAELVRTKNPDFVVHKVFLDAYPQEVNASGESYPLAKNKVTNMLKSGVLLFDYSGHGGYNAITSESILNQKDIEQMTNKNHAFWIFVTCNFAQCDAGRRSAAESAVLNPRGGAIGILSATRTVYADRNTALNRAVCDTLFGHADVFHYDMTLGEAVALGKNKLSDENRLAYVLLGDPALRLNYPTDYQVQTLTQMDTLNALSVQQVDGQIIDEDSMIVSDFNGTVDITVYDKMQSIPTRDNDNVGGDPKVVAYNDYPNTLFTGSTSVKNGLFSYTFMVPKDIRYNYGNGRIVYYAHDDTFNEDAVGHFEQFIIGGTGSTVFVDDQGPEMTIYLNVPSFKNGDRTYATPRFFAELNDSNGINTAGAGIGHDLLLVIDDDPKQTYTLNEYFVSESNSYQAGRISYLMEALPDGPHSLTFRAWDLLNNSTTKGLNFIVDGSMDPSITSVTTYPNPVQSSGILNMLVLYDQPDELIHTEIYLYNLNGQMVYSHQQENPDEVAINIGALGIQPGIYMYNVRIKTESSKYSMMSGKIIVTR